MGARTGHLSGLLPRRLRPPALLPSGVTFADSSKPGPTASGEAPTAAPVWKRWFRILLIDQWAIYFPGLLLGALLPAILVASLARTSPGLPPTQANILVYAAQLLGQKFGALLSGWTLLTGFVMLFTAQIVLLDLLARSLTDALYSLSQPARRWTRLDPRRIYYPALLGMIALLVALNYLTPSGPAAPLLARAREMASLLPSLAALIFPLLLIFLNLRLPRPARLAWWSVLALLANALFFGYFFINLLAVRITGAPLVRF